MLGILVWGTAQAASYDIFGYRRAVNGVLLLAVRLVANMALTNHEQFDGLVLFSAAALVLLLLAHAADERSSWLRHRIWRGRDFQAPHIQGGMAFASVAVAGSLLLTTVASSAPLAGTVQGLGSDMQSAFGGSRTTCRTAGARRYPGHRRLRDHRADHVQLPRDPAATSSRSECPERRRAPLALVAYNTFQTTGWTLSPNSHQDSGHHAAGARCRDAGPGRPDHSPGGFRCRSQSTSRTPLSSTRSCANEPDSVNAPVQRTLVGNVPTSADLAWLTGDGLTLYTVDMPRARV